MTLPKNILVATDFSECAQAAEEAALGWAAQLGASLHWTHAVEVPLPIYWPYSMPLPEMPVGEARSEARGKLEALVAKGKERGLQGTCHLGDAPAEYSIAACAKEIAADLVVVGTHGHRGLNHLFLGSVAEKVVKLSSCSVVAARSGAVPPRKILVAVDFSESSTRALDTARALAKQTGASLRLVHAMEFYLPMTPYDVVMPTGVMEKAVEDAEKKLAALASATASDIETSWVIRDAAPHLAISEAAEEAGCDLVVIGSRGLTGLKHAVLGSVAERTLRTAPCSVWTVR